MKMANLPDMYLINTGASKVSWRATTAEGSLNTGTINFKSGNIKVNTKQVVGGFMYVNMQTLKCNSIADQGFNKELVDELRSPEAMNVIKYKEMTFKIVKATRKDVLEDSPNYMIMLQVGLKGLKKNVEFPAFVDTGKKNTSLKGSFVLEKEAFMLPYDIEIAVDMNAVLKKK